MALEQASEASGLTIALCNRPRSRGLLAVLLVNEARASPLLSHHENLPFHQLLQ
jgi:hypothetical protein